MPVLFFGRVNRVSKRQGSKFSLGIITPITGGIYNTTLDSPTPIMEGDCISGNAMVEDNRVMFSQTPYIAPGTDDDTVQQCIFIALKRSINPKLLLAYIHVKVDDTLSLTLDLLASSFQASRTAIILSLKLPATLESQMVKLLNWWYKSRVLRRLRLIGLTYQEIEKAKYYNNPIDLYTKCLSNPYPIVCLTLDKCDEILRLAGQTPNEGDRYCGEIVRHIARRLGDRCTYIPYGELRNPFPNINKYEDKLVDEYKVRIAGEYIALEQIIGKEEILGDKLSTLIIREKEEISEKTLEPLFNEYRMDDDQRKAIIGALNNNLTLITGGAGTGKTRLLLFFLAYFEQYNIEYIFTSFTGKAVARIKEATSIVSIKERNNTADRGNIQTLHSFVCQEKKYTKLKYIIVDEASMVETSLFHYFIRIYPPEDYKYKIVFVGDVNQLYPIGWGCLFKELLESRVNIPKFTLTHNHRAEGEGIRLNAERVLAGECFVETPDFHLNFKKSPLEIIQGRHFNVDDVKIITPFKEAAEKHNRILQEYFSQGQSETADRSGNKWYYNDQVMMIKNNYEINVMNGEEGRVVGVDEDGISVLFTGRRKECYFTFDVTNIKDKKYFYPPKTRNKYLDLDTCEEVSESKIKTKKWHDIQTMIGSNDRALFLNFQYYIATDKDDELPIPPTRDLTLSYAMTIHKSQGSEWKYVIVDLTEQGGTSSFVTRNLVYTALTRAIKEVFLVGCDLQGWLRALARLEKQPTQLLGEYIGRENN